MVDIIHLGIGVDKFNKILDNLDDIILSQYAYLRVGVKTELLVNTVATYLAQVITLVREEEVLEYLAS